MGAFLLLPPPLVLAKGAQKLKYSFNIYVKQKPEKKEQKNFNFNLKKTAQIDKSPAPHWRENPLEEEGGGHRFARWVWVSMRSVPFLGKRRLLTALDIDESMLPIRWVGFVLYLMTVWLGLGFHGCFWNSFISLSPIRSGKSGRRRKGNSKRLGSR